MAAIVVGPKQNAPYRTDGLADQVQVQAAINALSSGDTVWIEEGATLNFSAAATLKTGIIIDGFDKSRTFITGFSSGYIMTGAGAVNNVTIRNLTLNGNFTGGKTAGGVLSLVNSSGHVITDVTARDCDGSTMYFGGVTSATVTRLKTRCTRLATGTSHGIDIDAGTGNSTNIVFNDCDLENGIRDATKAESCTGIQYNNCTFRSTVIVGDNVSTTDVGVTFTDCTFDTVAAINLRSVTASPTFVRNTFTHDGGVMTIFSDLGAPIVLTDNHFYGRNTWVGFNAVTWIAVTNITATGNRHYKPSNTGGKTLFCNPKGSGHANVNTSPYLTPHRAHVNFEQLVEDVNLDENDISYACMPGEYSAATYSTIALQALTGVTVEGYDGYAIFDLGATSTDFINFGAAGTTSGTMRQIKIKNGSGGFNGTGITVQGAATILFDDVHVSDMVSAAGGYGQFMYCSGAGYAVTIRNCSAKNITALSSGGVIRTQDAGTIVIDGMKIYDYVGSGGGAPAVRIIGTTTSFDIRGLEMIRCNGAGGIAGLQLQRAGTVSQCTFRGNTGNDIDSAANAVTVNNSILPDYAQWVGTAKTANYNLIGTGSPGGTNIAGTPTYVDAANDDYRLAAGSSGKAAGTLWWTATNPRPNGANGKPFPDRDIDIGANQTRLIV